MKRKYIIIPLLLCISGMVVVSCDSYLDESPDNRVELNTLDKASQLLTNAYSSAAYTFTEWMSDNVSYTTGTVRQQEHNQAYQWEVITQDNQDTPNFFWTSTYDAIAHSNEVLAVIDKLPGDRNRRRAIEAEALLTRAYGHFMLVNLFGKHYDEETASSDLGIPYVFEPETEFIKQYRRNSVQEVYDLIEEDLLEGLRLVDDSYYQNSGKYHFTRNAALAFASRYYLFRGDFEKCAEYSSQLLGSTPENYIRDIYALLDNTNSPDEFIRAITAPGEDANLLLMRQVSNFPVNVGFWPSPNLVRSLYDNNPWNSGDARTADQYPIFLRGTGWTLAKYEFLFERSSLTSNVGFYYTIAPVFRGEEVLLNRAESYVYLNNIGAAIADLQAFALRRYEEGPVVNVSALRSYYQSNNDQIAVLLYILDERRKEFMHEGLRWFDIKRYRFRVVHTDASGFPFTLDEEDARKVLQIPQAAIDVGGLQPNPR